MSGQWFFDTFQLGLSEGSMFEFIKLMTQPILTGVHRPELFKVVNYINPTICIAPVYKLLNYCLKKTRLQDIQQTLNIIRNQIDAVDAETKWAALELMLASSASVVALAKQMAKPDTRTVTPTMSIPKTNIVRQPVQQLDNPFRNDAVRTVIKPVTPQKSLSNQKTNQ